MHAADDSPLSASSAPRRADGGLFDNRELSTIAMVAALHFVVSFVARLAGAIIFGVLGPFAVYLDGIGSEALPCLLLAVIVTLIPRVGTATLTIATVWLLNGIVSGSFSFAGVTLVGVSIVAHEAILLLAGISKLARVPTTGNTATIWLIVRTSLAIGLANAVTLYIQFAISIHYYQFHFAPWYVHSVALLNGLVYGAIGAAIGTRWGFELRRTAP